MKIHSAKNYEDMSLYAANILMNAAQSEKLKSLCITSGSTPIRMYEILASNDDKHLFQNIDVYAMDEYAQIDMAHPCSNAAFFQKYIISKITVKSFTAPDTSENPEQSEYYQHVTQKMPFDILVLGIGTDGHIAFNMPKDTFITEFHKEPLNSEYLESLKKLYPNSSQLPKEAITLGIKDILSAGRILLLANGKAKAKAISSLLNNKIDPAYQASILKLHPNLEIIADYDALSLKEGDDNE